GEESAGAKREGAVEVLGAEATQTQDAMRRAADEDAAAFEAAAAPRVGEVQDTVREHSRLLDELTRLHTSTTDQINEVRALVVELRDAQERQLDLDAADEHRAPMIEQDRASGAEGTTLGSTPDRRGLDHEGRPVGIEKVVDERLAIPNPPVL